MKKLLVGIMLIVGLMSVGCKKVDLSEGMSSSMSDKELLNVYVDNLNEVIDRSEYREYNAVLDESNNVHEIIIKVKDETTLDKETADDYLNTLKGIKENLNDILYEYDKENMEVCITIDGEENSVWTWTYDDENEITSYLTVRDGNSLIEHYGSTEESIIE